MADRIGQQLGKYRLIRLLGRGAFAEVYLGEHVVSGNMVAVKVLYDEVAPADVARFRAEGWTIKELHHPHIIRLLELDTAGSTPFLVMEFAPGGTLRERYPQGTKIPLKDVVRYVQQLAAALQYAHERSWIHRDLKPENVLFGANNELLLSDFGVAALAQHTSTMSKKDVAGTADYMAPEQIVSKPRPASDQYALAVMVYEWLTGERPFVGTWQEVYGKQLHAAPPPLREKAPEVAAFVEQAVMIALEKEPKQRFASVSDFAKALELASQGVSPLAYAPTRRGSSLPTEVVPAESRPGRGGAVPPPAPLPPAPAQTAPHPKRNRFVQVLLAALALVLIATVSAALILSRSPHTANHPPTTAAYGQTSTPTGSQPSAPVSSNTQPPVATSTTASAPTNTPLPGATSTSIPTPTNTPPPTPTNTPTPTPTNTPRPPSWQTWYSVNRPACDDSSAWQDVNHAATGDCSSPNGLVLSQYSNTLFAELDLDSPNGSSSAYNQTQFQVSVQAGFLNPGDTSVWAAIIVQTPKTAGQIGGYMFAVNSQGKWQLQKANSGAPTVLQSGQVGINVSGFTMQVTVQNGSLWASINGQQVVNSFGDSLNPSPGVVGLMEQSARATSSAILYNSFVFSLWG